MSKDDTCKVTFANKHKERKPKKPHYIPRPWGKPYNYKCFQCPFTCMEKSHLYNHMKYSLCKNSLSLLIESDWPYKKGNILHPNQLRPFQQAHAFHVSGKNEIEQATQTERQRQQRNLDEDKKDRENQGQENEENRGQGEQADIARLATESVSNNRSTEDTADHSAKKIKQPESILLMSDMLSLEDHLLRAHSGEVENQLKHYKLSKNCLTTPALLSEQWRLLMSSHTQVKSEGSLPKVSSSLPCYPPPPNLIDYQDPTGLNFSVLGVGYPLSPSLPSYMNSVLSTPATVGTAQTHAQLTQLPFLASAAQLIHPASSVQIDRAPNPPHLYYPFLCEHAFRSASGQSDASKPQTSSTNNPKSIFQPKVSMWKVPALLPMTTTGSPADWVSPQRNSLDQSYRLGDNRLGVLQGTAKEGKTSRNLKRTGTPLGNHEAPRERKLSMAYSLDLLKNIETVSTLNVAAENLPFQNSLPDAQLQSWPTNLWYSDHLTSPKSEVSSLSTCGRPNSHESTAVRTIRDGASESVGALLSNLSKALDEYQEAEQKMSNLEKEELPAQYDLWDHLSKIRSELSHINQTLKRTAHQSDGPLDLSVKKDSINFAQQESSLKDNGTEKEDKNEELEERKGEEEDESEKKAMKASLESRKKSLDMLIKMSQASMVNTEIFSPVSLTIRPAEALWPNRTTKCEADSSVLLCPDGRSIVFNDIPASAKISKNPLSLQRPETQCPPSPLTATDN